MRRFLQDLTVLAAVTAVGGFGLTRAGSSPPIPPPTSPTLHPLVVSVPRAPIDDAMDVLRNASHFAGAAIGYGGTVPTTIVAWLTILYDPHAESHFLRLIHTATPAGQMYALAGLRARSLALFTHAAQPFRRSRASIRTIFGCIVSERDGGQIVAELEHGAWIGEFVSARRDRYFGDLPWPN